MRFFFCWICVFSGAALGQMGGALREVHEIGGKRYEVAKDEVARKDGAGRMWVEKMERQATAEKARQRAVVQQADLVMYEAGQGRSEASRRVVRNQIVVKLKAGVDAKGLAAMMRGMIDASTTRRPSSPCTRSCASTTSSGPEPMRQLPTGW